MRLRTFLAPLLVLASCHDAPPADAPMQAPITAPSAVASVAPLPSASAAQPSASVSAAAPARIPAAQLAVDDQSPCKLRGKRYVGLPLSFHGRPFALVSGVEELQVFASPAVATARAHSREVDFVGEVQVTDLRVEPKSGASVDGASVVTGFQVRAVGAGGQVVGTVTAPSAVGGAQSDVSRACADVVIADGVGPSEGDARTLRAGASGKLLDAPGGHALAELHAGPKPLDVRVLETRGAHAHVVLEGSGANARGWLEARLLVPLPKRSALESQAEEMQLQMLGALGGGPTAGGALVSFAPSLTCGVPVYLRDGDTLVTVGTTRVAPRLLGARQGDSEELPIDLGARGAGALVPFVRQPELAACPPAASGLLDQRSGTVPARGPRADAQLGATTTTTPIANADRVVAGLRPKMRACYQKGLESDPAMQGSLKIVASVAANGEVSAALPADLKGLSAAVAACMTRAVRNAQFDAPGAPTTLTVPVRLQPSQ